jgi:cysteinyl-tRNA synthetase
MHNNFLVDRTAREAGKMSKSSGEFLTLQTIIDKGVHPLAYRLMCLQAHYRSELEFSWDNLLAALTRLKRMVATAEQMRLRQAGVELPHTLQSIENEVLEAFDQAISDDLNTPQVLTVFERALSAKGLGLDLRLSLASKIDGVLGLQISGLERADLRIRPTSATLTETEIEARLMTRKTARAAKDFATSDRIRDELAAAGVEVMDGDPLGWDWKIEL